MQKILVLTRNVLNEQSLQENIQRLSHEVYCTFCDFDQLNNKVFLMNIVNFFPVVIISETISDHQMAEILKVLNTSDIKVFRKVECLPDKQDREQYASLEIDDWIEVSDTFEVLREKLERTSSANTAQVEMTNGSSSINTPNQFYLAEGEQFLRALRKLSSNERKVFYYLVSVENKTISRKSICEHIWSDELTNSQLSSLSNIVKKIRGKFQDVGIHDEIIKNHWKKGYAFTDKFWQLIQLAKSEGQLAG
ncbi:winged helix-turn-helix domain-containing protein [Candidatus Enterococcus ferrettii]|uniref:OmpR/PhoB-type domain-containing protein n=1 Tax=Candidatus Enterococcus ferrettii TaxID=2815324 RepID=A0ABV0EIG7_9ENTE|nr:helix-turn-helix domain-containing protein [Enterococcus sp. 665A]MBO1341800.1 winged helix-turn-helix domain-containing protein [Enterococcus sp. 665A]